MKTVCDRTEAVVAGLAPSQYGLPTPCSEWAVRDLANHLLATLELGAALLSDRAPTVQAGPGGLPAQDLVGEDLIGAYRVGAAALVSATTAEAVRRSHVTPFGEMPGAMLAGFAALDVAVHGWDLATATGQEVTLEADAVERLLEFARQTISEEAGTRAPRIGPEVAVPADADATARLVGYLGRHP